jgi:hypothetical protein
MPLMARKEVVSRLAKTRDAEGASLLSSMGGAKNNTSTKQGRAICKTSAAISNPGVNAG